MAEDGEPIAANALDAIRVAFIHGMSDIEGENAKTAFTPPLFAHQLFKDEKLYGHKAPKIELIYSASDLQLCLTIQPDVIDGFNGEVTDLVAPFAEWVQHPYYSTPQDMLGHVTKHFTPLGDKVHEYSGSALNAQDTAEGGQNGDSGTVSYEVYRSTFASDQFKEFNKRLQTLNVLFIDGASYLDETDEKWTIFTLYEKSGTPSEPRYKFLGFTTVYTFFAFPDSTRCRLSQFLILPHAQKKGHALQLYRVVHTACKNDKECVELLVEDPTDDFQRARLSAEMLICREAGQTFKSDGFSQLSNARLTELGKELCLGRESIIRLREIFRQMELGPGATDEEERDFRLMVKSRLFRKHNDELESLEAPAKKKRLTELYDTIKEENQRLINRHNTLI